MIRIAKVLLIMGGFHLSGHLVEKIIPQTVTDMEQFNLEMIIPAHCTGWRAVNALIEPLKGESILLNKSCK